MLSLFSRGSPSQMLTLELVGSYDYSTTSNFQLLCTNLLSFLKNESFIIDASGLEIHQDLKQKNVVARKECNSLIDSACSAAQTNEVELHLTSSSFYKGTSFSERFDFYRSIMGSTSRINVTFHKENLDRDNLELILTKNDSSELYYATIEDVEYRLLSRDKWSKEYLPSHYNNYRQGDSKLKLQSPYLAGTSLGEIPWTGNIFWFGKKMFSFFPKEKFLSFNHAKEVKELDDSLIRITNSNNPIVTSDKQNIYFRSNFTKHLTLL